MELQGRLLEDRSGGMSAVLSAQSSVTRRDLTLEFASQASGFELRIFPSERLRNAFPEQTVPIKLDSGTLSAAVNRCQTTWWFYLLGNGQRAFWKRKDPFQKNANNPITENEYRHGLIPKLAQAGEQLFVQIFRPSGEQFATTRKVGEVLRELIQEDLWISIRSRRFFAPWNFMYLGDVDEPDPKKFWGFPHLIEHDIADQTANEAPFSPALRIATHFDDSIDRQFPDLRILGSFRDLLTDKGLRASERNTRDEFRKALKNCADEDVFYFCCHARTGEHDRMSFGDKYLSLTDSREKAQKESDPQLIEPNQIDAWLDKCELLPGRPIVFINACEAAKTGSIFYEGFANKFLDHSASAVIGPELEMPIVFARDFAASFFSEFLRGGQENTIGKVLLRLRRRYMTRQNPLGLAYSLYRGGGLMVEAPVLGRAMDSVDAPRSN